MRAVWQALRSDLMRSIDTLKARRQFEVVKQNRPELQRFADVSSLLDYLHCKADDLDDKDRILAALVRSVHAGGAEAEVSKAILWLALWPGLDALYRRLWRHFRDAHEDLVSEIAVHFFLVVHRADLTRIRRVAATLLRNVERDVRSILRRSREEQARLVELPDHDDQHEGRHGGDPGFAGGPADRPSALRRAAMRIRKPVCFAIGFSKRSAPMPTWSSLSSSLASARESSPIAWASRRRRRANDANGRWTASGNVFPSDERPNVTIGVGGPRFLC